MAVHPVSLMVAQPARLTRADVGIRVLFLVLVGLCGLSVGGAFMLLFLALPVFAAVQTSALGGGAYVTQEGPRVVKLLRWVVAALAYLLQLTDRPPDEHYAENITLEVKPGGVPTPSSALLRWAQSVPALLILCVISVPAAALWVMSLVLVLWSQKVPPWLHRFQLAVLSYAAMLLAYHGSVVDAYATLDLGTSDHGHHADPQPV